LCYLLINCMKRKLYYILIVAVLLFGCKHQIRAKLQSGNIKIDTGIAQSPVYKMLDKQRDFRTIFHRGADTLRFKTSNVSYRTNRYRSIDDTAYARLNNCGSYLINETLKINIGISSGFVADGFTINCHNRLFTILPYHETDAITVGEEEKPVTFQVINQSLTLSKYNYQINDSVYGKINFKIIETNNGQKIHHIGYGYFRAKVDKR